MMDEHRDTNRQDSPTTEPHTPPTQPQSKRRKILAIATVTVALLVAVGATVFFALNNSSQNQNNQTAVNHADDGRDSGDSTNTWSDTVDATKLPLGDGKVGTEPRRGYVFSCSSNFRDAISQHGGPWIDETRHTWNSEEKVVVRGEVHWKDAEYSVQESATHRTLKLNDLPVDYPTGQFPISRDDPAYDYDRNPNGIEPQNLLYSLPLNPTAASSPNCTSRGAIGVLSNGVLLFNALDDAGNDAAAHETQDLCDGHPAGQQNYHYHTAPSCLLKDAKGSSTLIGYAMDGYGIYVERDADGNLPTNADLDECHGRTSEVLWNGKTTKIYHYSATLEYPYTVGCYHGAPITTDRPMGPPPR